MISSMAELMGRIYAESAVGIGVVVVCWVGMVVLARKMRHVLPLLVVRLPVSVIIEFLFRSTRLKVERSGELSEGEAEKYAKRLDRSIAELEADLERMVLRRASRDGGLGEQLQAVVGRLSDGRALKREVERSFVNLQRLYDKYYSLAAQSSDREMVEAGKLYLKEKAA